MGIAVLPLSDPMASGNSTRIGALSLKHKIPLVSPFREITDAGGLLSYGPDLSMLFRRSASLVDQILKGAKPGDLPIGKPTDFELGANVQGLHEEAAAAVETVQRIEPGLSTCEWLSLMRFARPEDAAALAEGLRRAGMPG